LFILNLFNNITLLNFSCHCLDACFKSYNDLTSLQTFSSYLLTINPWGCSMYKPSYKCHSFKKVVFISIWYISSLLIIAMTINIRIKVIFDTSKYMSKSSTTFYCLKPLTTSVALYLSIVPSTFIFLLNIHLWSNDLFLGERSTSFHVWLFIINSILLSTAFLQ